MAKQRKKNRITETIAQQLETPVDVEVQIEEVLPVVEVEKIEEEILPVETEPEEVSPKEVVEEKPVKENVVKKEFVKPQQSISPHHKDSLTSEINMTLGSIL